MKKTIKSLLWATTVLIIIGSSGAWAIPMADVKYLESDLGTGFWEYDFTVYNTSSPTEDLGSNIFDIFLDFGVVTELTSITNVSLPDGWKFLADPGDGSNSPGFVDLSSLNFGAPPNGNDIAPGVALGGFEFQFDQKLNAIDFSATFTNITEPGDPFKFGGTATPVPEPSTVLLLAVSLTGLAVISRKKFNNSV